MQKERKRAVITVKLIDENITSSNKTIAEETRKWFLEDALPAPWARKIEMVAVADLS